MFARITFIDHKYPDPSLISVDLYTSKESYDSQCDKISSDVIEISLPPTCEMSDIYAGLIAARPDIVEAL